MTKTSPNKEEVGKEKKKRNTLKASPLRGDAECDASRALPAGEVNNVGGLLARFERKFKQDPNSIPDLEEWQNWLEQLHEEGDFDDPNAQRARRLADDIDYYLDDAA